MTGQSAPIHVELFTQHHCAACRALEAFLREKEIPYVLRDVGTDAEALRELMEQGYMSTPVLRLGEKWIPGFDRRALQRLFD